VEDGAMTNPLRAKTLILGAAAALLPALLCCGAAVGAAPRSAVPVARSCSVAGLGFSEKQDGVTYGVAVVGLRARMTTCSKARSLAGTVAKDILRGTKVPARLAGMTVTAKEPCAGCTPDTTVIARSGPERVTFTVRGGA
jgi:hypothetical protein